jgi:hypothetical protein
MDDPGDRKNNQKIQRKGKKTGPLQRYISNVSDVLSPIWLRRIVQINNGFEWFVLGSRYNFLFNFRLLLVIVYLTYETFR